MSLPVTCGSSATAWQLAGAMQQPGMQLAGAMQQPGNWQDDDAMANNWQAR